MMKTEEATRQGNIRTTETAGQGPPDDNLAAVLVVSNQDTCRVAHQLEGRDRLAAREESDGIALAGRPAQGDLLSGRRSIRSGILVVAAAGLFTAALSGVALHRAISVTTTQRIERGREALREQLEQLEERATANPDRQGEIATSMVGMRAGIAATPAEIAAAVPAAWRPFATSLAARARQEANVEGETTLAGANLVMRIHPGRTAPSTLMWAAVAIKPSAYLRSWRHIVFGLTVSALVLVVSAAGTLIRFRRGAVILQGGLAAVAKDLAAPIPTTSVRELDEIGAGISSLARHLAEARRIQERLGHDLERQERLAALGRVVAGVAHEVRNPLASIKLRLDLAMTDSAALSPRLRAAIEHASSEITRLDRLVADLLTVSGRPLGPRQTIETGDLLRARVDVLGPWAAQKGIALRASGEGRATADPDALTRAIDNLVRNAVEASPPGAAVDCSVAPAETTPTTNASADWTESTTTTPALRIRVEDHGAGVPAARAAELFEPFFTTKSDGSGLGLAISRAIARAHGGDLIYARADDATRFELFLPAPGPAVQTAAPVAARGPA